MAITHYPNGIFLQNSIRTWGEIPLWSNSILSGYPFVADPLSGLQYPPGWLAVLFPLPLGFNLVVIFHLVWGGIGAFMLARQEGLSLRAAILSAVVFECMPKLYSHLGAGHLTLIYAVCWTPWLLWVESRFNHRKLFQSMLPGALIGVIALADIRWTVYAVLLWIAYSLKIFISSCRNQNLDSRQVVRPVLKWAIRVMANGALALLVASPLLFPLAQFARLSTRSLLTSADNLVLSLPPSQLVGLAYPKIGGSAEWTLYPGAVVLMLAFFAGITQAIRKKTIFWLGIVFISIFLSLGSYIPFLERFFALPGLSLLRVPPRFLFLTGLAFSILAGNAFEDLSENLERQPGVKEQQPVLLFFGFAAFISIFAAAACLVAGQALAKVQFAWGGFFATITAVAILTARARKISTEKLTILLTSACLIDLIGVNGLSLVFYPSTQVLSQGKEVAEFLRGQEENERYRVYSPSYSLPQQTSTFYGLELADGIDPMQLTQYARYMQEATGVPSLGYSVTLPPFSSGTPATDNRRYIPDAQKLGLLNVKYVVAEFPLASDQLTFLSQIGQTRVYSNPLALPRAWVQPLDSPVGSEIAPVEHSRFSPNRIEISVKGPGLLVLSEINYPGWEVTVDQLHGDVVTVAGLLRGVALPGGDHQVTLFFHPRLFYAGLLVSMAAWGLLAMVALSKGRR
jgi:hypothetical protein